MDFEGRSACGYSVRTQKALLAGHQALVGCAAEYPDAVASIVIVGPFHTLPDMRLAEKFIDIRQVMFEQPDRELYAWYWYLSQLTPAYVDRNYDEIARLATRRAESDAFLGQDVERIMKWDRMQVHHWLRDDEFAEIVAPALIVGLGSERLERWP